MLALRSQAGQQPARTVTVVTPGDDPSPRSSAVRACRKKRRARERDPRRALSMEAAPLPASSHAVSAMRMYAALTAGQLPVRV
jgi:hypothetical protein